MELHAAKERNLEQKARQQMRRPAQNHRPIQRKELPRRSRISQEVPLRNRVLAEPIVHHPPEILDEFKDEHELRRIELRRLRIHEQLAALGDQFNHFPVHGRFVELHELRTLRFDELFQLLFVLLHGSDQLRFVGGDREFRKAVADAAGENDRDISLRKIRGSSRKARQAEILVFVPTAD
jgi:hypothetical protein